MPVGEPWRGRDILSRKRGRHFFPVKILRGGRNTHQQKCGEHPR
jgi:hypothetical protein